jgi:hypothetical protein
MVVMSELAQKRTEEYARKGMSSARILAPIFIK